MIYVSIYLVSCVGEKLTRAARARDLYQSDWFRKARAYVEAQAEPWHILSAEHGLLDPVTTIEPYERTLGKMLPALRKAWAELVVAQIRARYPSPVRFVVLAGAKYREHLVPMLEAAGHMVEVPMKGLGIGEQLAWLKARTHHDRPQNQDQQPVESFLTTRTHRASRTGNVLKKPAA